MRTGDNSPPPADWQVDPRVCPLPDCDVCRAHKPEAQGYGVYPKATQVVREHGSDTRTPGTPTPTRV